MEKNTDILSAEQLSLILDVSIKTLKKLAMDNELPSEVVNRQLVFRFHALVQHFERLERGAA